MLVDILLGIVLGVVVLILWAVARAMLGFGPGIIIGKEAMRTYEKGLEKVDFGPIEPDENFRNNWYK